MKRILIVEDDKTIAALEKDYLEIYGFETEIIGDGKEALDRILHDSFDLILLDLMLPGLSGYEICKAVRREKEVPILMVTARNESLDKIRGLGLGADDFISKPFDPLELVARVNAHLNRYERLTGMGSKKEDISFGEITIDPKGRKVFCRDTELRFPKKEFELLLFLAENPNVVFSKEQLLEKIWGYEAMGDVATVTVHINRIREKIEKDSNSPEYIETVWGTGYRFNAGA